MRKAVGCNVLGSMTRHEEDPTTNVFGMARQGRRQQARKVVNRRKQLQLQLPAPVPDSATSNSPILQFPPSSTLHNGYALRYFVPLTPAQHQ